MIHVDRRSERQHSEHDELLSGVGAVDVHRRVGLRVTERLCLLEGLGDLDVRGSLLTAYSRLTRDVAEPMLASAFRGVLAP